MIFFIFICKRSLWTLHLIQLKIFMFLVFARLIHVISKMNNNISNSNSNSNSLLTFTILNWHTSTMHMICIKWTYNSHVPYSIKYFNAEVQSISNIINVYIVYVELRFYKVISWIITFLQKLARFIHYR